MPSNTTDLWQADGAVDRASQKLGIPYAPRPPQQQAASIVQAALNRQTPTSAGIVALEAATGVGKTLAYLVPCATQAAKAGEKILVSTHTITLGTQILTRDGKIAQEVVAAATGRRPSIAHLRGRRNFLSPSRANALSALLRDDGQPRDVWEPYAAMARVATEASLRASAAQAADIVPADAWDLIDACLIDRLEERFGPIPDKDDLCLVRASSEHEMAAYRLSQHLADSADILVTTHAWTALALAHRTLVKADEPPYHAMIIDEADQWAQAAASVSLIQISLTSFRRSIEATLAASRHIDSPEAITSIGASLLEKADALAERAPREPDSRLPIATDSPALTEIGTIVSAIAALEQAARGHRRHMASAIDGLTEHREDLARLRQAITQQNGDFWQARWVTSRIEGLPSIGIVSRAPGRIMKRLWQPTDARHALARTTILTSATLATPGFSKTSRWIAIEAATGANIENGLIPELCQSIEPKEFGTLRFRFADPAAPIPRVDADSVMAPDAMAYAAAVINTAHAASLSKKGRTLVLVPAYADVERLLPRIPGALGHKRGTSVADILKTYLDTPGCCLITPAAWVGVNLPGHIQNLVIPRLPFPPIAEASNHAGFEMMRETLNKLAQGIGRAIRQASDDATVWFADPRMPIPECITDTTGQLPAQASNPILLAAIPARFRKAFGITPDIAEIGVAFDTRMAATKEGHTPKPWAEKPRRSSAAPKPAAKRKAK